MVYAAGSHFINQYRRGMAGLPSAPTWSELGTPSAHLTKRIRYAPRQ